MRFYSEDDEGGRPVWMSPEEAVDPCSTLREFCGEYSLSNCRFYLWKMLAASISAGNHPVNASAGDQLYFFESLMPALEALYLLYREPAEEEMKNL
ncbi:MAG: hypothetical protein ABS46_04605 [Cytophagaceae bacterium SCN 52-12]|nr:MAG: hypothetical protein ABS46_04605 [Cytophagaceae bacterium SCN 52-12]